MNTTTDNTCRLCLQSCNLNTRLNDRYFREKTQDVLVLYLKIDEDNISIVCDSCQSQVESFYQFKWKCRQNERNRWIQKGTNDISGTAEYPKEDALSIISSQNLKPRPKPVLKAKKPSTRRYYKRKTDRVNKGYNRVTKEQLATMTRREVYRQRNREQFRSVCELCGKAYHCSYMPEHMNRHRGIRPFACKVPDCGAAFGGPYALKKHTQRMHSDGQHPCPQCNKMFTNTAVLRDHMKCHEEKTIFCEICNLGFHLQSRLKTHMLVHTQQRDHKCEFCGKAFYANQVLELHRRSHTGERPYACHVCDFSHAHRILYVKHMQKFHPGEEIRTLAEIQRFAKVKQRNQQVD